MLALLRDAIDADVELDAVGGTLGHTLVLHDLRLGADGHTVVHVPRLAITYSPLALLTGHLTLTQVRISRPRVHAVRAVDGWRMPRLRSRQPGAPALPVTVGRLLIEDGRVTLALPEAHQPRLLAATALHVDASATFAPDHQELRLTALRFTPRGAALPFVRLSGTLVADADGVRVRDLDLTTARSWLVASGRIDPERGLDGQLTLAPLAAADVHALAPRLGLRTDVHAVATAAGGWRNVRLEGRANLGAGGRFHGAGMLDLTSIPLRYAATIDFVDLDPGSIRSGLVPARAHGRLHARGQGWWQQSALTYRLALSRSEIAGWGVDSLGLRGRSTGALHHARGRVVAPAGAGRFQLRAALTTPPAYRLGARLTISHLEALAPHFPGKGTARIALHGIGNGGPGTRAALHALLTDASVRSLPLRRADLGVRLDGDRLTLTGLTVGDPRWRAWGAGMLDLGSRTAEVSFRASTDLAAPGAGWTGSATLDARAHGSFNGLTVTATAAGMTLRTGAVSAERAGLRLDLGGIGGAAPAGKIHLDAGGMRLGESAAADLGAEITWQRAAAQDRLDVSATATANGRTVQRLGLTLARTAAQTTGELRELLLTSPEQPPWHLMRPVALTLDDHLTIGGLGLAAGEQRLTLTGRLGLSTPNDATLDASQVRLGPLCTLVADMHCTGELGAHVAITGTGVTPRLVATLSATHLRVEDIAYGDLGVDARYAERAATVHAALRHPVAGELLVDGSVPLDLAWTEPRPGVGLAPVDLRVHAQRLDATLLRTLAPAALRQTAGRVTVDMHVTGPASAPRVDGHLAVDQGRLELADAGVPYDDIRAEIVAAGDTLDVTGLHARSGSGTLDGGGSIRLAGSRPVDLQFHLHDFYLIRRDAYEATVSGAVQVGGTLAAPDVHGALDVERAVVRPAALPASGPILDPDPTITLIDQPAEPVAAPASAPLRLINSLRLGLDVRLGHDARIRRPDANIELGGALRVEKPPDEPVRVIGEVRLLRGWYAFQGRRFTIDEGSIRLTGSVPPEPIFDLTASSTTSQYTITAHVEGAGTKPTLRLSSDPPLEQADILAVLLFGRPTGELGGAETLGLQRQTVQLTTGYVAPELQTSVMNSLGLDVLGVDLPQGTERGRVSVGRYVANDVFVSLAQEMGARGAGALGVEYGLSRHLSVTGSTSTRGDSAVDLFWHRRY